MQKKKVETPSKSNWQIPVFKLNRIHLGKSKKITLKTSPQIKFRKIVILIFSYAMIIKNDSVLWLKVTRENMYEKFVNKGPIYSNVRYYTYYTINESSKMGYVICKNNLRNYC